LGAGSGAGAAEHRHFSKFVDEAGRRLPGGDVAKKSGENGRQRINALEPQVLPKLGQGLMHPPGNGGRRLARFRRELGLGFSEEKMIHEQVPQFLGHLGQGLVHAGGKLGPA
jgi:hypothetical protein